MAPLLNMAPLLIFTLIAFFSFNQADAGKAKRIASMDHVETYIVHLKHPDHTTFSSREDVESWHQSFLPKTKDSPNGPSSRLVYSYHNVVTGFAAKLSAKEVKAMSELSGFISARPQGFFQLHTTHTPNFLGLNMNFGAWNGSNYGKGVIIGLLDSGITPDHPSFNDDGMSPPPAKWKGKCAFNGTVCNNKLIGARNFIAGSVDPPSDGEGHGTHTASTAGGNFVKGASADGQAQGTAVGMAPMAHVAMYKVCGEGGCFTADILAGMDAAVEDGVDILSLSIGGSSEPFYYDGIAIGAFGAIGKGVFVSCSAGNSGPESSTLSNEAPWILTVGASTLDRTIKATAVLGNNESYDGESLFQPSDFDFPKALLPLYYSPDTALCGEGSFNGTDIKGKVVLCERGGGIARIAKGQTVKDAGGAAMILVNQLADAYSTLADAHVLPATHLSYTAGEMIKHYINSTANYINSTANATATILFRGTIIGDKSAPVVTSFSSRGPNSASPGILKPDIIGPGVSILAAWPVPISNTTTNSTANFNVVSGTSMSCPHLSGIAALVKSAHPNWSPAAIKSAIMTSASQVNLANNPILNEKLEKADVFATGAGHVNPSKALNPGLIYDLQPEDYIPYLSGLGYTDDEITSITGSKVNCSSITPIKEAELNYPSFAITLGTSNKTYTRTVTNVGEATSSYIFSVVLPDGVAVTSNPQKLDFTEVNQKLKYEVTFSLVGVTSGEVYVQGSLAWTSTANNHVVRSPISVKLE